MWLSNSKKYAMDRFLEERASCVSVHHVCGNGSAKQDGAPCRCFLTSESDLLRSTTVREGYCPPHGKWWGLSPIDALSDATHSRSYLVVASFSLEPRQMAPSIIDTRVAEKGYSTPFQEPRHVSSLPLGTLASRLSNLQNFQAHGARI
jgi:hypothetical protein